MNESSKKEFFHYVVMNVVGMIGLSCYILADTFFVSKGTGIYGLTALNLAIPVYSFVHGTGLMLGIGGATKYSVFRGQRDDKQANWVFTQVMYIALFFVVVYVVLGAFCSSTIASLLGADSEVLEMTRKYLQLILFFSPAFMINDILISFVRNDGNPKLSMIAMLTGSLANIVLDYVFIFPMNMGIGGAALATGIAPVISLGILSLHRIQRRNQFHLVRVSVKGKMMMSLIALGIPSFVGELAAGIVMIVFNGIILGLRGNVGVAAYGVIANISLVAMSIFTGIAQGMQPLTSRAYGRNDQKSMKQYYHYGMITAVVIAIMTYVLLVLLSNPIVMAFNSEGSRQLQRIAKEGLEIYFLALPFMGINIVSAMYFTSVERALAGQTVSLARGLFVIIPVAFLLSFSIGINGVWLSLPVTEGIVCGLVGALALLRKQKCRINI